MKLHFKLNHPAEMLDCDRRLLGFVKTTVVTRNESEKVINSILDHVSGSEQRELLAEVYETTLRALEEAKNDRLWLKTSLRRASASALLRPRSL